MLIYKINLGLILIRQEYIEYINYIYSSFIKTCSIIKYL